MSATNELFTRWKAAKGIPSDRQAAAALGVSHAGPAQWRAGRNGSAAVIERMAHDLGEDPIPVILQAFAEAARDAEDKRALVRMAKKLAASGLALLLALMPYSAPTSASEPALAQSRLEGLYIMRNAGYPITGPPTPGHAPVTCLPQRILGITCEESVHLVQTFLHNK